MNWDLDPWNLFAHKPGHNQPTRAAGSRPRFESVDFLKLTPLGGN